jgi:hypothetical protein
MRTIQKYIENRTWEGPGENLKKSARCGSLEASSQPGAIQATSAANRRLSVAINPRSFRRWWFRRPTMKRDCEFRKSAL